jgi:integrase
LNAFFKYYEEMMEEVDPAYVNPMPRKTLKIEKPMATPQQEEQEILDSVFTVEHILQVLKRAHSISQRSTRSTTRQMFPILALLTVCGMRLSECVSIRIQNLHLKERYLVTGMEENARKNKRPLTFCFPEEVGILLQEYLLERHQTHPQSDWLFPWRGSSKDKHLTVEAVQAFLRKLFPHHELGVPVESHTFRRTLSTFRLNGEKPAPLHIEETLSNHAITSLVMRSYNKYKVEMRRRDYDHYFPKEYHPILEYFLQL